MRAKQQLWVLLLTFLVLTCGLLAAQDDAALIREDHVAMEFVGQVINSGASSNQFGYLSNIEGLDPNSIFSSATQNETTAKFTFFTEATSVRVVSSGPLRIVNRVGTTTIYFNTSPAGDFNNPGSFQLGTPIQVSKYRQQVVFNTITSSFTTVHTNRITSNTPFSLRGHTRRLGAVGLSFRTSYFGYIDPAGGTPSGWFGGYATGVDRED